MVTTLIWLKRGCFYGGNLGNNRDEWFALYAIDKKIDDYTFCEEVKRGLFRLHPEGFLGISKGCITLKSQMKFNELRGKLLKTKDSFIPKTAIKTYGVIEVS